MLLYSYRGEKERKKEKKRGENGHIIILLLSKNQPKISTISKCKRSPNYRNSKNRDDADFWNSRNTDYFHIGADLWNSIYIVYYFSFPICWIPKIGTYFKIFDLCISRSTSYFWNKPISGIPIVGTIWSVPRFLKFQKYGNSISTNTLQSG